MKQSKLKYEHISHRNLKRERETDPNTGFINDHPPTIRQATPEEMAMALEHIERLKRSGQIITPRKKRPRNADAD